VTASPRFEIRAVAELRELRPCCSEDERAAALRLRFEADRDRTLGARALARVVLSEVAGIPADALRFGVGPHGKPYLLEPAELRFNTTHSGDHVGLVVGEGFEVGIDLEVESPRVDPLEVGPTVFTPGELAMLHGVTPDEARRRFYVLWTRKEAALKAWGTGFSLDARAVEVGALSGRSVVHHPTFGGAVVESLALTPSVAGALAWTYPSGPP
jgi:4'-phosphopantetheinyl transferase